MQSRSPVIIMPGIFEMDYTDLNGLYGLPTTIVYLLSISYFLFIIIADDFLAQYTTFVF